MPPDLGLSGLFFVLFLSPIISVFIRRRWRIAEARKEEIRRLLIKASEETAKAEVEATYVSIPLAMKAQTPLCVVCCTPTTKLCSRCKAVRYCSGRCQIIHWRQGHKDECSSSASLKFKGTACETTSRTAMEAMQSDFCENMRNTSNSHSAIDEIVPTSMSKNHIEAESNVPFPRKVIETTAFSPESVYLEAIDVCVNQPSDSSKFSDGLMLKSHVTKDNMVALPFEHFHVADPDETVLDAPGATFSSQDELNKDAINPGSDLQCHAQPSANLSSKDAHFQVPQTSKSESFTSSEVNVPISVGNVCANNALSPENLGMDYKFECFSKSSIVKTTTPRNRSRSLDISSCNLSYSGDQSLLRTASSRFEIEHSSHAVSSNMKGCKSSSSNGFKTHLWKVVRQLKPSKFSKSTLLDSGNDLTFYKSNYKMPFPNELFLKLYKWDKSDEIHPFGLINCGNSCYANVVLQCLAFTPPLTAYLVQGFHTKTCSEKGWCFTCEFENTISKARQGKSPVSPIGILSQIRSIGINLGHGREEDAHEFLRYAVDTMQASFLKEASVNKGDQLAEEMTLIQLTFGGYLRSKIRCAKCLGKSERRERIMDLTVEIDGDIENIKDALEKFTRTEILDGENKYQCVRCKSYEKAKKKLTIWEAPNILTIALKRFQSGKFGKLNKPVKFDEVLNLTPYMSGKNDKFAEYNLYGVIVHLDTMNASFSGHYVCYVKHNQKWYKIDDSVVKVVDADKVLSKEAYMLLYSRNSPRAVCSTKNSLPNKANKLAEFNARTSSSTPFHRPTLPIRNLEDHPFPFAIGRVQKSSSSDSSSLFSNSDEGSCTTDSTLDSTSIDDLLEPTTPDCHFSQDPCSSASSSKSPHQLEEETKHTIKHSPSATDSIELPRKNKRAGIVKTYQNLSFLYSDGTRNSRKLGNSNGNLNKSRISTNSNIDRGCSWWAKLGNDLRSDLLLRKFNRDRMK